MRVLAFLPALSAVAVLLTVIPYAAAHASSGRPVHVQCAAGRNFTLLLGPRLAIVDLPNERLTLIRRPSSLGQHYRDQEATLIVDGRYVAFVQKGDLDWRDCQMERDGADFRNRIPVK